MPTKKTAKKKRASRKKAAGDGATVAELAMMFECSRLNMRNHLAPIESCGTRGQSKLYPLDKVKAMMAKKLKRGGKSAGREELEKQKLEVQIKKIQIEIDERLRKLIPADTVRRLFLTHVATVRRHILRQQEDLPPLVEGLPVVKVGKVVEKYNLELLAKLSEMEFEEE